VSFGNFFFSFFHIIFFQILFALFFVSRASVLPIGRQLLAEVPLSQPLPEPISPYSFGYTADAIDGSSSRQESSDGSGVVRGSYSVLSAVGGKRIVNYIADENGFRAQIQTNEFGTEAKNPADVTLLSSQPPAEEIALKFGSLRPEVSLLGVKSALPVKGFKSLDIQPLIGQKFEPFLMSSLPLETPIKLLSRIPKTIQKPEVFAQNFESF